MTNTQTGRSEQTDSKSFAPPYSETTEGIDPDTLSAERMRYNAFDFTYETHSGTRTVRSVRATSADRADYIPEGATKFWYEGRQYAFFPGECRMMSVGRDKQNVTVATADELVAVEEVTFPSPAPVEGGVSEGAEATIYYRSPQSDSMQSVTIEAEFIEGEGGRITGSDVGSDRQIEVLTRWERTITSRQGGKEQSLGRTARVEFPRGRKFVVEVEGMMTDQSEKVKQRIRDNVRGRPGLENITVDVCDVGGLKWGEER